MSEHTRFTQSAEFRTAYANTSSFRPNQWDIALIFGSIKAVEQTDEPANIEFHTEVSLGWSAAKALALFLVLNINAFEAENGTVKIPLPALQPDIGHLAAAPIAELIAGASRIQSAKLIELLSPAAPPARYQ
jgi:hypothetical protein